MPEEEARKNIVRFSDPLLHRVGFGIELMGYGDPKEHLVLIRRKSDDTVESPGLSVVPRGETRQMTLNQFCNLLIRVIEEKKVKQCIVDGRYLYLLRFGPGKLCGCKWDFPIYEMIDDANRLIGFLHEKLPWQEVRDLVWQNINI